MWILLPSGYCVFPDGYLHHLGDLLQTSWCLQERWQVTLEENSLNADRNVLIDFGIETLACFNAQEPSLELLPGRDEGVEQKDTNTNRAICMMQGSKHLTPH